MQRRDKQLLAQASLLQVYKENNVDYKLKQKVHTKHSLPSMLSAVCVSVAGMVARNFASREQMAVCFVWEESVRADINLQTKGKSMVLL